MRGGLLVVALVLLVALVGVVAWYTTGSVTPPPQGDEPPSTSVDGKPTPAKTIPGVRVDATPEPEQVEPPPPPPAEPAANANPTGGATEGANGSVLLTVRDAATGMAPAAAFRWRIKGPGDAVTGNGTEGKALLPGPHDVDFELVVEADQRQAVRKGPLRGARPGEPPVLVEVTLVPIVVAAGITLHVHDLAMQPQRFVRVDAFRLHDANRETSWFLESPLWARRATAEDGRYQLPALPAGEYGIRLIATDEQGALLPLLPFVRTYRLTGDNGFVEDAPLEPGCALVLELVDAHGNPYDPTSYGTATIGLRLPDGPPVQRKWFCRQGETEATAIDVLPGIGNAALAHAIVPGTYQLEVFANGEPRVRQLLQLRPERQVERIVVP